MGGAQRETAITPLMVHGRNAAIADGFAILGANASDDKDLMALTHGCYVPEGASGRGQVEESSKPVRREALGYRVVFILSIREQKDQEDQRKTMQNLVYRDDVTLST